MLFRSMLYRIHYLQWTGVKAIDMLLGVLGLGLLVTLAYFGARLAFGPRNAPIP